MTYSDIRSLIYQLTSTNSTSLPDATLNLYTQPAENHVASLIMQADGRWQYDDSNQTDFPIATTNLVYNQQDYSLSASHLRISGVSVLTNSGLWQRLQPFDPEDLKAHYSPIIDRASFFSTPGRPLYYDKLANSIILYPAPDNGVSVTLTAGLKLYFERGPVLFDYTTGTVSNQPGFNSLYHSLIAYWAAYNYCLAKQPSQAQGYLVEAQRLEAAMLADYESRDKDERQRLTMAPIRFR